MPLFSSSHIFRWEVCCKYCLCFPLYNVFFSFWLLLKFCLVPGFQKFKFMYWCRLLFMLLWFESTELLGFEIYCSHAIWRHFGHYSKNVIFGPPSFPFTFWDTNYMYFCGFSFLNLSFLSLLSFVFSFKSLTITYISCFKVVFNFDYHF